MAKEQQGKWVVPNPQIPRSFGLMNIIFGAILVLVAIGFGLNYVYAPVIQKKFQLPIKEQQEKRKAERAEKITELKRQEDAAKNQEEKQALADERTTLEQTSEPDLSAFEDLQNINAYTEPRLAIYYILDVSTAVVLNVLMIIAGGGLMALAEWARRLSIRVAQLKILRWLAMVIATMVLILPMTLERAQKGMAALEAQMRAQPGGAAPPVSFTAIMRYLMMFGAVVMVFTAIVASVYPAISWWYLSRPAARAACLKKQPAPDLPETAL